MIEKPKAIDMLKEACDSLGIEYTNIDPDSGMVVHIEKDGRDMVVSSKSIYPLNNNAATTFAKDKAWTYMHLSNKGFKVPEGRAFFTIEGYKDYDTSGSEIKEALEYANSIRYPVFVKPNSGAMGNLAQLIESEKDLIDHFENIAKADHMALVQKPINQNEYRIFVLDGQVEFTYRKEKPIIVGDGDQSIRDLVETFNSAAIVPANLEEGYLASQLQRRNISPDTILEPGQIIKISANSNPNEGGRIVDFDYAETIDPELEIWAVRVTKACGLKMAGLDVFGDSLYEPEQLTILEVNGGPALSSLYMSGLQGKVVDIWEKIMDSYFD